MKIQASKLTLALGALALITLFCLPSPAQAAKRQRGDGHIVLYNVHLKEYVSVKFRNKGGKLDKKALDQVNYALRCRQTQKIYSIRPELLDLVDRIQDHFKAGEIQVVSGYRSPEFNKSLFKQGHKVTPDSPHMYGQAMDIRIPGISPESIRDYASKINRGGVGFYPQDHFVHVDIGANNRW